VAGAPSRADVQERVELDLYSPSVPSWPYTHLAARGPQELFSITVLYALSVSESEDSHVTVFAGEVLMMQCQGCRQEFRAKQSRLFLQYSHTSANEDN